LVSATGEDGSFFQNFSSAVSFFNESEQSFHFGPAEWKYAGRAAFLLLMKLKNNVFLFGKTSLSTCAQL
jgi:hypothetical protein